MITYSFENILLSRNYEILNQMKPGAGANVYLVQNTITKEKNVLKFSFVDEAENSKFEERMKFWKDSCNECEDIVALKEYFFINSNGCSVMEFCSEGDLETLIKKKKLENGRFDEEDIIKILISVVRGVKTMHRFKVIHRDIKPANILICEGMVFKLADFNISRILNGGVGMASTMAGTFLYSPPEVLNNERYTFSVDMYSIGAVLYELMMLSSPFTSITKILAGEYTQIDGRLRYSDSLVALTKRLLSKIPTERPTAEAVLDLPFALRAEFGMALQKERRERQRVEEALQEENRKAERERKMAEKRILKIEQQLDEEKKKNVEEKKGMLKKMDALESQNAELKALLVKKETEAAVGNGPTPSSLSSLSPSSFAMPSSSPLSSYSSSSCSFSSSSSSSRSPSPSPQSSAVERCSPPSFYSVSGRGSSPPSTSPSFTSFSSPPSSSAAEQKLPIFFLPETPPSCAAYDKSVVRFTADQSTVAIKCRLFEKKIYVLDLVLKCYMGCGVVLKSKLSSLKSTNVCGGKEETSFLLRNGVIYVGTHNRYNGPEFWKSDGSARVTLVLNATGAGQDPVPSLYFVVNNVIIPLAVRRVPVAEGVYFAFGGTYRAGEAEVMSLRTVPHTFIDSKIKCVFEECEWE